MLSLSSSKPLEGSLEKVVITHFPDEKTDTQRDEVAHSRTHSSKWLSQDPVRATAAILSLKAVTNTGTDRWKLEPQGASVAGGGSPGGGASKAQEMLPKQRKEDQQPSSPFPTHTQPCRDQTPIQSREGQRWGHASETTSVQPWDFSPALPCSRCLLEFT